jgi:hypothetical protein
MSSLMWIAPGFIGSVAVVIAAHAMLRWARARSRYKKYGDEKEPGGMPATSRPFGLASDEPQDHPRNQGPGRAAGHHGGWFGQ